MGVVPWGLGAQATAVDFGLGEKVALKQGQIGEKQRYLGYVARRAIAGQEQAPSGWSNLPAAGEVRYFTARLGGADVPMVMDISKISRAKLYVDTDGDGNFSGVTAMSAENKVSGSQAQRYGYYDFGDVRLAKAGRPGEQPPSVKVTGRHFPGESGSRLEITPGSFRDGRAKFGEITCQVALLDGDSDGKFAATYTADAADRRGESGNGFDLLAVDLNGDQAFDHATEIYPMTAMVGVHGKYYGVKVAEDGASVEFAPVRSAGLGELSVGSPQVELTVVSETCAHHLEANGQGTWKLPDGTYRVASNRLVDRKGGAWLLEGSGNGFAQGVQIQKDGTQKVTLGCPLTPKFDVDWNGDVARIGFELLGAGGEKYAAGATRNGQRDKAPAFKIIDREGKPLESGNFEYG